MSLQLHDVLSRDIIPEKSSSTQKQISATLEAQHQQKMRQFQDLRNSLPKFHAELESIQQQILDLHPSALFSDEWRQLNDREEELKKKITSIQKDEARLNYFLNVGNLLFQYYDAQESLAKGDIPAVQQNIRTPSKSVLSYFSSLSVKDSTVESDVTEPSVRLPTTSLFPMKKASASSIDSSDGLNRDKLMEKYMTIVDPNAIKSGILPGSSIEPGWGCCPACDVEMTFYQNEAMLSCPQCGYEEFILVDSEKPSYKEPPREITYFAYKKINHFNEWLAQFQAKENTDIPQDVIESVLSELKKQRIRDYKKIDKEKVLEILRKLKLTKMYDHVQQIKNRIQQHMTMLVLSKEQEEKLQFMFKEIQPAFIKYCPAGRSNFLSYPYVLFKLCQLLEMDEFLPCFNLLKSREKLFQQDEVWKKICQDMRWEFIRSL